MAKVMSKSELVQKIADGMTPKDVKSVIGHNAGQQVPEVRLPRTG
jgi:hypothetical protein